MDGDPRLGSRVIDCAKSESRAWDVDEIYRASWAAWYGYSPQGQWSVLWLAEQALVIRFVPPGDPQIPQLPCISQGLLGNGSSRNPGVRTGIGFTIRFLEFEGIYLIDQGPYWI